MSSRPRKLPSQRRPRRRKVTFVPVSFMTLWSAAAIGRVAISIIALIGCSADNLRARSSSSSSSGGAVVNNKNDTGDGRHLLGEILMKRRSKVIDDRSHQHVEAPDELSSTSKIANVQEVLQEYDEADAEFYNNLIREDLNSFVEPSTQKPVNPSTTAPTKQAIVPIPPTLSPTGASTTFPPTVTATTVAPTVTSTTLSPTTARPTARPTIPPSDEPPSPSPTTLPPTRPPTPIPVVPPTRAPITRPPTPVPSTAPPVVPPTVAPSTRAPVRPPTRQPVMPTPAPIIVTPPTPAPVDTPGTNCNLTPEGRSALINIFLRVVSKADDLEKPNSPQAKALQWIIDDDPEQVCPQDAHLIQRYVLVVFYYSTRGDRWTECAAPAVALAPSQAAATTTTTTNLLASLAAIQDANARCTLVVPGDKSGSNAWLTPGDECLWGGLGCNDDNAIVRIEMEQNGVAGTLPFELNRLQNLQYLVLEEGILTGTLPKELGKIGTLEQIDLNFNLLQGPIPDELYQLENLRQLDLNDNEFTGTISPRIGNLSLMTFFQIENNAFTGTVPTQMGNLTSLEVATMDNNRLSGTMPCTVLDSIPTLQVLTSDCLGAPNRPSPPLVVCECCTQCF